MKKATQSESILEALEAGDKLTQLDVTHRFGCTRLAARIADLRACGHSIASERVSSNGKNFACYSLIKKAA